MCVAAGSARPALRVCGRNRNAADESLKSSNRCLKDKDIYAFTVRYISNICPYALVLVCISGLYKQPSVNDPNSVLRVAVLEETEPEQNLMESALLPRSFF